MLACGAIAREVLAVHSPQRLAQRRPSAASPRSSTRRPELIAPAVDAKLDELDGRYERVFVAYADCGTGGALDVVLERHGVERLPGAHCYGFLAGNDAWEAMHDDEPATFYLTDFLARHFDALVIRGLGLDRHPELLPTVLRELPAPGLSRADRRRRPPSRARAAAERLGLEYEERRTGYGDLGPSLDALRRGVPRRWPELDRDLLAGHPRPGDRQGRARKSARVELSERFQEAIDAAAMRGRADRHRRIPRRVAPRAPVTAATTSRPRSREEAALARGRVPDDVLARLVRARGR